MSKKAFWQSANEDALSVYDAVYASLLHKGHEYAHSVAHASYQATIEQSQIEFQNVVTEQRYKKSAYVRRENRVVKTLRAEEISRPRQFWNWIIGKSTQKTSSVKLAKECVA